MLFIVENNEHNSRLSDTIVNVYFVCCHPYNTLSSRSVLRWGLSPVSGDKHERHRCIIEARMAMETVSLPAQEAASELYSPRDLISSCVSSSDLHLLCICLLQYSTLIYSILHIMHRYIMNSLSI